MRVASTIVCLGLAVAALPSDAAQPAAPDFSGAWARMTFGFERPASGQGPIGRYRGRSNVGGNFESPNLTPSAAAIVKQRSEILRSGRDYPNPSLNCWPMVSPYIFRVQEMQMIQKKDEVVFLFMQDHQVRRVRLNSTHPAKVTPSWYGDSVGHYEGDTLVVDTIGARVGREPVLDMYGSPYTDALHVIERYRLIDYDVAKAAQDKNIRDSGPVATEQAASVDEAYRGKGLQIEFTVEDKNVFKTPWSAVVTWRHAGGWVENVCAENAYEYYSGGLTDIPRADRPEF
ncbi:MAG: hypothetical protein KGO48_18580 [Alphaproteobacteria bacterium]|nr:hypothetical protein [Alphaproteobacteria bacterium]